MPPKPGPGPHPARWRPCATSPSARCAWPGSPTSPLSFDIPAAIPPGPSSYSASNAHEPDITTPRRDPGFAPDFAIENRLWIRQHPAGSTTPQGGSDHDRSRAWDRPARPQGQAVVDPAAEVRDLAAAGP